MVTGRHNPIASFLVRAEAAYYRRIMPPDLLIVLWVDPEVAVRRKTDENPDYVRARSGEVWRQDWRETGACVVDAGRPLTEVLCDIKSLLWAHL
jgi:thymidylate kinase